MTTLSEYHEKAISIARGARNRLNAHKAVIGTTVTRTLGAIEAGVGGGSAAAIDFYMGDKTQAVPEAMMGPVPVVATGAIFLTVASILLQKEEWSAHLAGFANGLAGGAAYAEGLRFLKAHEAASPAAPAT